MILKRWNYKYKTNLIYLNIEDVDLNTYYITNIRGHSGSIFFLNKLVYIRIENH